MDVESQGREAAERFRREHALSTAPLPDLVALIERTTDADVAVLEAPMDEHGLTVCDPERQAVMVGVAATAHPMRQRSTLAHELGHVIFQDWVRRTQPEDLARRSPEERRADAFARHLLLPQEGLRRMFTGRHTMGEAELSAVVQQYLVSPAITAIALHDAGLIDGQRKAAWMSMSTPALATRFGWIQQYRAMQRESQQLRAPQRLLARTIEGYRLGAVPAQAVATLWRITAEEAQRRLREAGIEAEESAPPLLTAAELPQVEVDLSALDALDEAEESS